MYVHHILQVKDIKLHGESGPFKPIRGDNLL